MKKQALHILLPLVQGWTQAIQTTPHPYSERSLGLRIMHRGFDLSVIYPCYDIALLLHKIEFEDLTYNSFSFLYNIFH